MKVAFNKQNRRDNMEIWNIASSVIY